MLSKHKDRPSGQARPATHVDGNAGTADAELPGGQAQATQW
jgi:hypothetical protein